MKPTETYYRCEYCDKLLLVTSPPPEKAYESGQIEIGNGTMLLPKARRTNPLSHAAFFGGHYCDSTCLQDHLQTLLGVIPEAEPVPSEDPLKGKPVLNPKKPIAYEFHDPESGHCYVDYIPRPGMTAREGYISKPLIYKP